MISFACLPNSEPDFTAARSISPVVRVPYFCMIDGAEFLYPRPERAKQNNTHYENPLRLSIFLKAKRYHHPHFTSRKRIAETVNEEKSEEGIIKMPDGAGTTSGLQTVLARRPDKILRASPPAV